MAGVVARDFAHIQDINLLALEADGVHFEYSKSHFNNNSFHNIEKQKIILGAIATRSGEIKFPVLEAPESDYGASIYNKAYKNYKLVQGILLQSCFSWCLK